VAHARIAVLLLVGCGGGGAVTTHGGEPPPPVDPFAATPMKMARFHSTRFGLSMPLPDGPRWRIDDHHASVLRATHAGTRSKVELVLWHEQDLMNRQKCEDAARMKGYGERAGEEVDTEVTALPTPDWDTSVWLGVEAGQVPTGHLYAFSSNIRKCLYFHFSTEAPPGTVSDRLAFVRLRILGDLRLDTFDIPRVPLDSRGISPH
jgi:hypothetical protein